MEGLKSLSVNLGTRTNNRIESFFSHLRKSIVVRGKLREFFERYLVCLTTLRTERSHHLLTSLHKQPLTPVSDEEKQFRSLLTPYAYEMMKHQLERYRSCPLHQCDNDQFKVGEKFLRLSGSLPLLWAYQVSTS